MRTDVRQPVFMDRISKEARSRNMSRIKGRHTKPELLVRKQLYHSGYRYRIYAKLPGKPDIIFKGKKLAVFIHGCFWHQHNGCKAAVIPKSNAPFWRKKLSGNIERDEKAMSQLERQGWRVVVVWECTIESNLNDAIQPILNALSAKEPS